MVPRRHRVPATVAVGIGILGVALGTVLYAIFVFLVYHPVLDDAEACEIRKPGPPVDYGRAPVATPGYFPISSRCVWPDTGEEIEMVSAATTVIPVGLVVGGLASAGVGGIAFWRTRARAADR